MAIVYCNLCGSTTHPHCDSPTCPTWLRCDRDICHAFGPAGRMVRLPSAPKLDRPREDR